MKNGTRTKRVRCGAPWCDFHEIPPDAQIIKVQGLPCCFRGYHRIWIFARRIGVSVHDVDLKKVPKPRSLRDRSATTCAGCEQFLPEDAKSDIRRWITTRIVVCLRCYNAAERCKRRNGLRSILAGWKRVLPLRIDLRPRKEEVSGIQPIVLASASISAPAAE